LFRRATELWCSATKKNFIAVIGRKSLKAHLELDFGAVTSLFADSAAGKKLSGELVTSAWDLFSVETLRDRHELRIGPALSTDVFVFGKGEPDDPSCTKVGGRPYWPADRPWPTSADGMPCRFLAQFNFADSLDISVDHLPGMVLLLLTDSEDDWLWKEDGLTYQWVTAGITPAENLAVPSAIGSSGPFYGVVYRSADYPGAVGAAHKLDVSQSYNLPILNGTKIGGLPHFIQGGVDTDQAFLCQLGSIQAAPNVLYPWINRREVLGLQFNNDGIYGDENCAVFGDMGSIYFFIDDDGNVSRSFECY
jgi:uncharacterized protein YwqG